MGICRSVCHVRFLARAVLMFFLDMRSADDGMAISHIISLAIHPFIISTISQRKSGYD